MFINILLASFPVAGLGYTLDHPYVRPTQPVVEIVALGDSFTSGVGSNGILERLGGISGRGLRSYPIQMVKDLDMWEVINGERREPRLTFLAHHSDRTQEVIDLQLVNDGPFQEDSWNLARGAPFGSPQLAVMTIGGNDADVAFLLNDCVFRAWLPRNCYETIDQTVSFLISQEYENRLRQTMLAVIRRGRKARGADPPESFQLYVAEYPNIFNDDNSECDYVDWRFLFFSDSAPLTTDLRKRFSHLNALMNAAGKRAAEGLKDRGVIYVDGINRHFDGHRFCEYGQTTQQMNHQNTWFWSPYSDTVSDGDGSLTTKRSTGRRRRGGDADSYKLWSRQIDNVLYEKVLLDFVFQNQTLNETLLDSETPPWTWPGAERYPDFLSLLNAMQESVDDTEVDNFAVQLWIGNPITEYKKWVERKARDGMNYALPFELSRSFHPKGAGYQVMKECIFAAIIQNREIAHKNKTIAQHFTGPLVLG